jgi:hypothetical protein
VNEALTNREKNQRNLIRSAFVEKAYICTIPGAFSSLSHILMRIRPNLRNWETFFIELYAKYNKML